MRQMSVEVCESCANDHKKLTLQDSKSSPETHRCRVYRDIRGCYYSRAMRISTSRVGVVVGLCLVLIGCVMGAPSTISADESGGGGGGGRMITVQSVLGRNRMKNGDVDPQTRKDFRILSMFESELNKIFSCYIRLSCPRTRSPEAIAQCEEIKDWPLYHQVMKMSGIKRYPYNQYAPQRQLLGRGTNLVVEEEADHHDPTTLRVRRHHRRQRRNEVEQNEP